MNEWMETVRRKLKARIGGDKKQLLIVALGKDASQAQTITGLIMAAGSLIAYIIGEGLADSAGNALPEAEEPTVERKVCGFGGDDDAENLH